MNSKQFVGGFAKMLLRILVAGVIIYVIFTLSIRAYDFGYQVFADVPVDTGSGRMVSVIITQDMDVRDTAKLLEKRGLIENARVFEVQEKLSEYSGGIRPGTYELNTAMNVSQMLEIMSADAAENSDNQ